MDAKSVYIGMVGTAKALYGYLPLKLIGSTLLAIVLHQHAVLFYAFALLVFLDCFTRWMSISHERLIGLGEERPSVLDTVIGIKAARSEGLISSAVMKHRFIGKIIVYIICTLSAALVDVCMVCLSRPTWAVATVVSYLMLTELLSIVENLNDAGIEAMKPLMDILNRRKS